MFLEIKDEVLLLLLLVLVEGEQLDLSSVLDVGGKIPPV